MQKQAPTVGRLLVMVGFALSCFGLLLFLWLAFGGPIPLSPKGYQFKASFGEATQLAKEADVRISGVSVGKVKTIETQGTGRSVATIQLDNQYAPLPKDSRAILRQKTLLGETFVELTPGHKRPGNMIPEGGTLKTSQVSPTVELDEIFRTFDPKTRQAFRQWQQSLAESTSGRGQDLNDALGNLAPFADDTTTLLQVLRAQQANVRGVINGTGDVFNALSARDHELSSLITNSNLVFSTTARRNADLQALFRALPTFETEATKTVNRLTVFSRATNPLVTQLRPAARELSPTLKDLSALSPDLKAFFRDLNPLITASKAGLPATQRFLDELRPLLGELDPPLRQLNPLLRYVSNYRDELRAFFANTPAATESAQVEAKSNGVPIHYLRTTNPINPENFAVYPHRIGSNRTNPYMLPDGYLNLATKGHLLSFETRQCGRGDPTIVTGSVPTTPGGLGGVLGNPTGAATTLLDNIIQFGFGSATGPVPAPPCDEQPLNGLGRRPAKYPQVAADPAP
jgi:ABC-type transporter Mla subunit MlaD